MVKFNGTSECLDIVEGEDDYQFTQRLRNARAACDRFDLSARTDLTKARRRVVCIEERVVKPVKVALEFYDFVFLCNVKKVIQKLLHNAIIVLPASN